MLALFFSTHGFAFFRIGSYEINTSIARGINPLSLLRLNLIYKLTGIVGRRNVRMSGATPRPRRLFWAVFQGLYHTNAINNIPNLLMKLLPWLGSQISLTGLGKKQLWNKIAEFEITSRNRALMANNWVCRRFNGRNVLEVDVIPGQRLVVHRLIQNRLIIRMTAM